MFETFRYSPKLFWNSNQFKNTEEISCNTLSKVVIIIVRYLCYVNSNEDCRLYNKNGGFIEILYSEVLACRQIYKKFQLPTKLIRRNKEIKFDS
jgi:hypothetical protein